MKRCMYCGNENEDSSQNCSKCGNRLLDITEGQAMPAQDFPEEGSYQKTATQEIPDIKIAEENIEQGIPDIVLEMPDTKSQEKVIADPQNDPFYLGNDMSRGETDGNFAGQEQPGSAYGAQPYGGQPDVQRGQTYAAQQYYAQAGNYGNQQAGYEQQSYGYGQGMPNYGGQPDVQQQYGGQAYGYPQQAQQYGAQPGAAHDYGRGQMVSGGARQIMLQARKMVKSPLFFLIALFYTVMVAANILNALFGDIIASVNAFQATVQVALGSSMAINFLNSIIDIVEGIDSATFMAANLIVYIPELLFCLGLWISFAQTSTSKEQMSTSGYTLAKIMVVLKFIAACLLLAAGLIISVAFVVAAGASASMASVIVGIILLVVMIIVSVLAIMFYVQFLHGIKVIKFNAKTGADVGYISAFVPVIGLLTGIGTVLTMLPMAPDDIFGLVAKGASAAWMLFGSIWMFVYRAKVRR